MIENVIPVETGLSRWFEKAAEPPAVLLGAGASMPQLPVARDLKQAILAETAELAGDLPADFDQLRDRIDQPHFTLELLCSMLRYRCAPAYDAIAMWTRLCAGVRPSALTETVARLRSSGLIGPIVTTNFDATCMDALQRLEQPFRVVTEWQVRDADVPPQATDIAALHGTTFRDGPDEFAPPLSATARGLARPFTPGLRRYLAELFRPGQPVLVAGYSGQDHYDLNPLLRELHREDPGRLRDWLWVCHREQDREGIPAVVADQFVIGDAAELLGAIRPASVPPADGETADWRSSLRQVLRSFEMPRDGLLDFLQDLRSNFAGAWAVLEHYRLYSAGYDGATTLTFGGVDGADTAHLAFRFGDHELPFGKLLRANAVYRDEDLIPDTGYSRSIELLTEAEAALVRARDAEDGSVRAEDRALLRVGMAIAQDYLGLIDRKLADRVAPAEAAELRAKAIDRFQACRTLAEDAGRVLASGRSGEFEEDLVQHRVWALIGQANIARTLDRAAAVEAYDEVINLQQALIAEQRNSGEVAGYEDVVAFSPQLWLRASEWLKEVLDCRGTVAVPIAWDDLDERWRAFADKAYRTCLAAYAEYGSLSSQVNSRFPAVFETRILYFSARAFAGGITGPERADAWTQAQRAYDEFCELAEAHPDVSPRWVGNARERFARIVAKESAQ